MDYQHADGLVVFRDVPDLGLGRPTDGLARLVDLTEPAGAPEVEVLVRVGPMPGSDRSVIVTPVGFPQGGYNVGELIIIDRERIVTMPAEMSDLAARLVA